MLKARNRKLSMILVLAMLMTMFAGLGTASAATTTYSCLQAPYLAKDALVSASESTLGTILIDWDVLTGVYNSAVITLPNGLEFTRNSFADNPAALDPVPAKFAAADLRSIARITKPGTGTPTYDKFPDVPGLGKVLFLEYLSSKEAKLVLPENASTDSFNDVQVAVMLQNVIVKSSATAGPANVKFSNIKGLFPQGEITIGNITGGAAQVTVVDTVTLKEGPATAVEFTIQEDTAKGLQVGTDTIKFKLPKGFTWTGTSKIRNVATGTDFTDTDFVFTTDDRELRLERKIGPSDRSMFRITAYVEVDETEANFGDVSVAISGKSTLVPSSLVIGTYTDYGYEIIVNEVAEILSGRTGDDATIKFRVKENVKGSLLEGRTIYFTLPDGVEWTVDKDGKLIDFKSTNKDGSLNLTPSIVKDKPEIVKATIANNANDRGEVEIEANLKVAANFTGDVAIEMSGSAGIDEEVTVAEAIAPLTGSVDLVEVKIGAQEQLAGDITITEAVKEALLAKEDLRLDLPAGVSWAKLPTITADNGLSIGTVKRDADGADNNNVLVIPIRGQSDEAATITISDVYLTVDRTVPEGDVKVSVGGKAINQAQIPNRGTAVSFVIAEVVTPAPGDTVGSCEFKIASNIYYAGGVAKVMDVAPYIKGDRTYVPMRYMGEALGAEVVWDDAARTVTLTKGDTTVVFTIGSTSYTVNGEAKTADVAPEIANDRTMLPARFVAEAFGAVVGWDAATQTVLIQK